MKSFLARNFYINIIWMPILLYFGERSYIAQDEGYYALQAKWILEKGNWLAPMWWDQVNFDRTIAIQWLIAKSNQIFGESIFSSHIPSLFSAILTLLITFLLSKKLIGDRYQTLSPILLSTTYLWVNNAHLAGQDMPLLAIEMIGIYSLIMFDRYKHNVYPFLCGISIPIAILLKSGMVVLPLIALSPYVLIYKRDLFRSHLFYIGLLCGSIPLGLWFISSAKEYGYQAVSGIIYKIKYLSESDEFSKSQLYYLWNIPLNTFPWIIPALYGMYKFSKSDNRQNKLILLTYPILMLFLLSIFKTKTSYYPLQITPFIAIASSYGLQSMFNKDNQSSILFRKLTFILGSFIFLLSCFLYFTSAFDYRNTIIAIAISLIGITWILTIFLKSQTKIIFLSVLGPYLAFSLIVQNGLLTNRDFETKDIFDKPEFIKIVENKNQSILIGENLTEDQFSKLVKISLYTPNIISRAYELVEIPKGNLFWHNLNDDSIEDRKFSILYSHKKLHPWVLSERK